MITYHKYDRGDDLYAISMRYRVPPCIILHLNQIGSLEELTDGTYIKIPAWWTDTELASGFCCPEDKKQCILENACESMAVPKEETYIVQEDDTLFKIAHSYHTTMRSIMKANAKDSTIVYPGDTLTIPLPPPNSTIYTVKPRESLPDIAENFGLNIDLLSKYNDIEPVTQLYPGMQLIIPAKANKAS